MPFLERGRADLGVVSRQQAGELTQERSMTVRRLALQASLAAGNEPCTMQRNTTRANYILDNPFGSGDVERMQLRNQENALWHRGVVISNTLATVWIACRGSVVKCARSQVRPFHEDDEAAHEHVTEHMRKLGSNEIYTDTISRSVMGKTVLWNLHLDLGRESVPDWECLFVHRKHGLFSSVYFG